MQKRFEIPMIIKYLGVQSYIHTCPLHDKVDRGLAACPGTRGPTARPPCSPRTGGWPRQAPSGIAQYTGHPPRPPI